MTTAEISMTAFYFFENQLFRGIVVNHLETTQTHIFINPYKKNVETGQRV